jgi:hypothetical protein
MTYHERIWIPATALSRAVMKRFTQPVIVGLGLTAAVLGIYAAEKAPYIHIAAGVVVVAAAVSVIQSLNADAENAAVRRQLAHLARSLPPRFWWKEQVNDQIATLARSHGHVLERIVWDSGNYEDPDSSAVLVFNSEGPDVARNGLVVVTSAEYSRLSLFAGRELRNELRHLIMEKATSTDLAEFAQRIAEVAAVLYQIRDTREGFKVGLSLDHESSAFTITLGDKGLVFDAERVRVLRSSPPIQRDLLVGRDVSELDSRIADRLSF